jgi:hypothetical protein
MKGRRRDGGRGHRRDASGGQLLMGARLCATVVGSPPHAAAVRHGTKPREVKLQCEAAWGSSIPSAERTKSMGQKQKGWGIGRG